MKTIGKYLIFIIIGAMLSVLGYNITSPEFWICSALLHAGIYIREFCVYGTVTNQWKKDTPENK